MSAEFICEVSGRRYKTARGARESAKRERLREYQRNYVRLNAGTAQEFVDLMVEKSKEFYGWDMSLEIKNSSFDFWQNREQNTKDKVLTVEARMWLSINRRSGQRKKICYFIRDHFEGVDLSFDWLEVRNFGVPGAYKTVKFQLTLKNFPKLLENYEKFLEQQSAYHKYIDAKRKASVDAKHFVESRPDYQSRWEEEKKIQEMLDKHKLQMRKLSDYYLEGYMRLWELSNGGSPEVDKDLFATFG